MYRLIGLLFYLCVPVVAHGAVCDSGYYINDGECLECGRGYFCPGDDAQYSCMGTIAPEYIGGHVSVTAWKMSQYSTSSADCICEFSKLSDDTRNSYRQYGICEQGPTGTTYNQYVACRVGYYAIGPTGENNWYTGCAPCDNGPANSVYTTNSIPSEMYAVESNCMWKCADGYSLTANNTCEQLCGAGFTQIKTDTGLSIPIYAARQTTPAINIGVGDNVCYAELILGRAGGAINISYDNKVYHTYSKDTSGLICPAGYWLSDGVCTACGNGYYCMGDNTRVSCRETFDLNSPPPSSFMSISNGTWASYQYGAVPSDCVCTWRKLSDERRASYAIESRCIDGIDGGYSYMTYDMCRVGYYAIWPYNYLNRYHDCAPCDNGPANSHYTSYSTPSVMYAVESNCPWECDDGYTQVDGQCVAQ